MNLFPLPVKERYVFGPVQAGVRIAGLAALHGGTTKVVFDAIADSKADTVKEETALEYAGLKELEKRSETIRFVNNRERKTIQTQKLEALAKRNHSIIEKEMAYDAVSRYAIGIACIIAYLQYKRLKKAFRIPVSYDPLVHKMKDTGESITRSIQKTVLPFIGKIKNTKKNQNNL